MNPYLITDTYTLLTAMESFKDPAVYLVDTFFPQKVPVVNTSKVAVEYRKGQRQLAPYIVRGARGAEMARTTISTKEYTAPMAGARRVLSTADLETRVFGEQPVYTTMSPQERAARLQAEDLKDLSGMIVNRRNKFASEILLTGKVEISGYADDGVLAVTDTIDYSFNGIKTPTKNWSDKSAKIYDDLLDTVNEIAEESGELPDIMVCGANVEKYLLANDTTKEFLMVSNRANLTIASLMPKYISPQARYLGTIHSLGLEMYSYLETYWDAESQKSKRYIPEDSVIIGKAGSGRQIFGAVTLVDQNLGVQTYASEIVPKYTVDELSQTISLSVYSRCILTPSEIGSWKHIKTCG